MDSVSAMSCAGYQRPRACFSFVCLGCWISKSDFLVSLASSWHGHGQKKYKSERVSRARSIEGIGFQSGPSIMFG